MKFKIVITLICALLFLPILTYAKQIEIKNINKPLDLHFWYKKNFVYQVDLDGKFKKPHETLKDRGGDCEDYAIFTCYVLKELGYKCKVIAMWFEDGGHAIAVFKDDSGNLSMFDNGYYVRTNAENMRDLLDATYPDWKIMVYFIKNGPLFYRYMKNKKS